MAFCSKTDPEYVRKYNLKKFSRSEYDLIPGSEKWNSEQLLNRYIIEKAKSVKKTTLQRNAPVLAKYLDWCNETERNFYSPLSLNNYTEWMLNNSKYTPGTLNKQSEIILAFFNFCLGVGAKEVKIKRKEIKRLKEIVSRKFVIRENHMKILMAEETLANIHDEKVRERVRHMLIMLWHTGMRFGDACTAEWSWIDWDKQIFKFMPAKTSNFGKVINKPISTELFEYLKDRKINHPDGKTKFICSKAAEIFSRPKAPGVVGCIEQGWTNLNEIPDKKVGVFWYLKEFLQPLYPNERVNVISFRYGAIQRLIENGVHEKVIANIYGWSATQMVSRYTNIEELSITEWKKAEKNILDQDPLRQLV